MLLSSYACVDEVSLGSVYGLSSSTLFEVWGYNLSCSVAISLQNGLYISSLFYMFVLLLTCKGRGYFYFWIWEGLVTDVTNKMWRKWHSVKLLDLGHHVRRLTIRRGHIKENSSTQNSTASDPKNNYMRYLEYSIPIESPDNCSPSYKR